jgi:hypothetical protein
VLVQLSTMIVSAGSELRQDAKYRAAIERFLAEKQ